MDPDIRWYMSYLQSHLNSIQDAVTDLTNRLDRKEGDKSENQQTERDHPTEGEGHNGQSTSVAGECDRGQQDRPGYSEQKEVKDQAQHPEGVEEGEQVDSKYYASKQVIHINCICGAHNKIYRINYETSDIIYCYVCKKRLPKTRLPVQHKDVIPVVEEDESKIGHCVNCGDAAWLENLVYIHAIGDCCPACKDKLALVGTTKNCIHCNIVLGPDYQYSSGNKQKECNTCLDKMDTATSQCYNCGLFKPHSDLQYSDYKGMTGKLCSTCINVHGDPEKVSAVDCPSCGDSCTGLVPVRHPQASNAYPEGVCKTCVEVYDSI